ncbi:MAG: hypothetical protein ACP5IX_01170, partial [Patescibacteria group bacterium]
MLTDKQKYRLLEMFPGITVWTILIGSIVLSFIKPLWAIYFIIIFDFYWLMKVIYLSIFLIIAWNKFHKNIKIDWLAEVKKLPDWQNIFHLIILATYKEEMDVIGPTF